MTKGFAGSAMSITTRPGSPAAKTRPPATATSFTWPAARVVGYEGVGSPTCHTPCITGRFQAAQKCDTVRMGSIDDVEPSIVGGDIHAASSNVDAESEAAADT